jgi:hypothetical protein
MKTNHCPLIPILEAEIRNVKANRWLSKEDKEEKIKQLREAIDAKKETHNIKQLKT